MKRTRGNWMILMWAATLSAAMASTDVDRQIEDAARESRGLRGILQQKVEVRSSAGVVTLRGTVQDLDQKALAEKAVRAIPGVERIENQLEVQFSGRERGDGWLELKIRGKLLLEPDLSVRATDVSVSEGVVTLRGVTETDTQRQLVEAMARNVEGVKDVRNELQVRSASAVAKNGDLR